MNKHGDRTWCEHQCCDCGVGECSKDERPWWSGERLVQLLLELLKRDSGETGTSPLRSKSGANNKTLERRFELRAGTPP